MMIMATTIKPLGKSEEEINDLEKKTGRKWSQGVRKAHVEMYHTPRPTDSDIAKFEGIYGKLPVEYKDFLLKFNGGKPKPNIIVRQDNELVINVFFPINAPKNYENNLYAYCEKYASHIPRGMIPIASSGGGDLILIQVGSDQGKIFYWYHEMESETDGTAYFENIELIADSFDGLLNLLSEVD